MSAMWRGNDVQSYSESVETLHHPAGLLGRECSAFAVDGRPDLSMVIFNPASAKDAELVRKLIEAESKPTKRHVKYT